MYGVARSRPLQKSQIGPPFLFTKCYLLLNQDYFFDSKFDFESFLNRDHKNLHIQ